MAAHLLGIKNTQELDLHFAKGNLFENLVITELMKNSLNRGKRPQFYFWRDAAQHEIDSVSYTHLDVYKRQVF